MKCENLWRGLRQSTTSAKCKAGFLAAHVHPMVMPASARPAGRARAPRPALGPVPGPGLDDRAAASRRPDSELSGRDEAQKAFRLVPPEKSNQAREAPADEHHMSVGQILDEPAHRLDPVGGRIVRPDELLLGGTGWQTVVV